MFPTGAPDHTQRAQFHKRSSPVSAIYPSQNSSMAHPPPVLLRSRSLAEASAITRQCSKVMGSAFRAVANRIGVRNIHRLVSPFQVLRPTIGCVSINMVYLRIPMWVRDECLCHQLMNHPSPTKPPAIGEHKPRVLGAPSVGSKYLPRDTPLPPITVPFNRSDQPGHGPYSCVSTDLIPPFIASDGNPYLFAHTSVSTKPPPSFFGRVRTMKNRKGKSAAAHLIFTFASSIM